MKDSLDTVESSKQNHLGITILGHGLDMLSKLTKNLFSVLHLVSRVSATVRDMTHFGVTTRDECSNDRRTVFRVHDIGQAL